MCCLGEFLLPFFLFVCWVLIKPSFVFPSPSLSLSPIQRASQSVSHLVFVWLALPPNSSREFDDWSRRRGWRRAARGNNREREDTMHQHTHTNHKQQHTQQT